MVGGKHACCHESSRPTSLWQKHQIYLSETHLELSAVISTRAVLLKKLGRFVREMPEYLENKLVDYIKIMDSLFLEMKVQELSSIAFQLAERNGISHKFNNGRAWKGRVHLRHMTRIALVARLENSSTNLDKTSNLLVKTLKRQ